MRQQVYALLVLFCLRPAVPAVECRFEQVLPAPPDGQLLSRSKGQERAVILIHGLIAHPINKNAVRRPQLRDWQKPEGELVRELAKLADVFAFAYSQETPVEEIVPRCTLGQNVATLKKLGYREIVLIGHSAGGLIARQLVEDRPDLGVTKVIQVCSPNAGSSLAKVPVVRANQKPFLQSLTSKAREKVLQERNGKKLPARVEFVCVVGTGAGDGDGVVSRTSQWLEDLRNQGIPAVLLNFTHWRIMRSEAAARKLAELVHKPQRRWNERQIAEARKSILSQ